MCRPSQRPRVRYSSTRPGSAMAGSAQLLPEEGHRAVPQQFGRRPVVHLGSVLVEEGVTDVRVMMDLDVLAESRELGLELPGVVGAEHLILLGGMDEHCGIQFRVVGAG